MNILRTITLGVLATLVSAAIVANPAFAWHPEGVITKYVSNETTNSSLVDANSLNQAVEAKKGDTLLYSITVGNNGKPAKNGYNDLAFVKITDQLPTGVALVDDPNKRAVTFTIPGIIKPGDAVTKTFRVKVTADQKGPIKNTACFTGDSTVKDNKQQGCDDAYVAVKVTPEPPKEEPKQPPKEEPKQETPEVPAELPSTGAGAIIGSIIGIGAIGYAASRYQRSRKAITSILKK
jgi:uncharacterized repeat protein (TIGR01451 family)